VRDSGEVGLSGVAVSLLNDDGTLWYIVRTTSDGLLFLYRPRRRHVSHCPKRQPAGYLESAATVGSVAGVSKGVVVSADEVTDIVLAADDAATGYDFGEVLPATI